MTYTHYHSQYLAHRVTLEGVDDDAFAKSLSTAKVQMNPHQVDAALFALQPPVPRGAILADEVGLGKTIEASLVIAQRWAEKRRRILLIVPASLRKQWTQELLEKFGLQATILESKSYKEAKKQGVKQPFEVEDRIVVTSYEFAALKEDDVVKVDWDLVIFDEAHRLRNVYKKGASLRAKALQRAVKNNFKLLLTATPLQNSLMELFGLVSIIDEKLFGDEASFKINYGGKPNAGNLAILRDRLKPICLRTLRKDVQAAGHINYTKRLPTTFKFEPDEDEQQLYEGLSAYLKRKDTIAFGDKPNQLVTLVVRKILGSSTFAVADTLAAIIERLRKLQPVEPDDLADIDTTEELKEEWTDQSDEAQPPQSNVDPVLLKQEIAELEGYRNLALSIHQNAKGRALISKLGNVLDEIVAKNGSRKAVIFTESVRTQKYLAELLSANGYQGQIALMNGSNSDAESQHIYEDWKKRHAGSDAISGSKTADMKAAIVEAFKKDKTILIATESGAEGINLQFCSLLINFDLPWNPQRVEQRIGRCHRYGQKIDVMVINFLNTKNRAEERILELLEHKFNLFSGVFGASDEVLGAIEQGTDFVKRVLEIVQTARNDEEIDKAFNQLRDELGSQIDTEIVSAREKLMGHFDQNVVKRLSDRKDKLRRILGEFERRLITIARGELPNAEFFEHDGDGSPCFKHNGSTFTTGWPLADDMQWKFFRLADGNLAQELVGAAKGRQLPVANLKLSYAGNDGAGQLSDVKMHIGKKGWLSVSRLRIKTMKRNVDHLVVAATADDGSILSEDTLDRLFLLPGTAETVLGLEPPSQELTKKRQGLVEKRLKEAETQNADFLTKEEEKLDAYADDLEKAAEAEIKLLEDEIKAMRKESRGTGSLAEKVEMKRAIKRKEGQRDELRMAMFTRRKDIRKEVDDLLDDMEESLKVQPSVESIFTVRWELHP
ncbi:MAG: DEAD/DEAH box helicase family protein [Proteobacteria bacterium]|nr:DEAD/DEAH box helicase family protein [Pseudomonadota bacterium]